jgi:general secretion pathway protein N
MKNTRFAPAKLDRQRAPWRTAALAACVGLGLALLLFAPAAWLSRAVQALSDGRVVLADAQGTVWRGSAQLLLTGGQGSSDAASLPGRVDWTLRPALHGASMHLNMPCCAAQALQMAMKPGWSHSVLELLPAKINLPASWLSGLGAPWNTLDPQGQLILNTQALQVMLSAGRARFEGQISLDLLAMSSRLSTLSPLGDYRLTLAGGDVPTLALQTLQGALQLSSRARPQPAPSSKMRWPTCSISLAAAKASNL